MFGKTDDVPHCPHIRAPCRRHGCTHYVQLQGLDPQTGKVLDEWMCVDIAMLKVALEGAKETRQAGAAIESFRNESVKAAREGTGLLLEEARRRGAEIAERRRVRLLQGDG